MTLHGRHRGMATILRWVAALLLPALAGCSRGGATAPVQPPPPLDCASLVTSAPAAPFPPGSFGHARGPNSKPYAIAIPERSAGAIVIAGYFEVVDDRSTGHIARLSRTGVVDPGFRTGSGFDYSVLDLQSTADGSGDVYAAGDFTAYDGTAAGGIVRLNCDGSVDQGFATGAGFDRQANTVAFADDGSGDIYVGGGFDKYQGVSTGRVVRLHQDGTRDTAFSPVIGSPAYFIAPAGDGSHDIYVARDFVIQRRTANGGFREGYTQGSFTQLGQYPCCIFNALAVAQDHSGDVYVAGDFSSYNGTEARGLVRLNGDGSLDTGFNPGPSDVKTIAVATDGSGDIYIGGNWGMARLKPDGSRDTTLAMGSGFDGWVYTIRVAPDGSGDIYVAGDFTSYNGTGADRVARIHPDGSIATEFSLPSRFDRPVYALARVPDGSGDIYAGGAFSTFNGIPVPGIARLKPDGTLNPAFVSGTGFDGEVWAILDAGDGSGDIYASGPFSSYNGIPIPTCCLVRLAADGTLIRSFPGFGTPFAVVPDITSRAYVGIDGDAGDSIARLNPDGTRDPAFDAGSGFSGFGGYLYGLALATDPSGNLYAAGHFTHYNGVAVPPVVRLHADGSLDDTFHADSRLDFGPLPTVNAVQVARDGSGDVYVGGEFHNAQDGGSRNIVRLNPDGTIDDTFAIGNGFGTGYSLLLAGDTSGDIYVGLEGGTYDGVRLGGMMRLNSDGTLDTAFESAGLGIPSAMVEAGDGSGDLYIGAGSYLRGCTVDHIARITASGAIR